MAKKMIGIGLLPKLLFGISIPILLSFLVIMILVFSGWDFGGKRVASLKEVGAESLRQLSALSIKESQASLNRLGEKIIQQKASDVAAQIEIFVGSHPRLKKEDWAKDTTLKEIAVQKVGETGYTAVHDSQGINYFHSNPKIVGTDLHDLAPKLPAFWKILEASLKGAASGYYDWKEADGGIRQKYMYLAPVKGTDLIVAATTYIDEFSKPAKAIEEKMKPILATYLSDYQMKVQLFYLVIFITLVILLVVVFFYSRSMVRPIRHLSEVANKISMGELDTPIQIKARGEVGVLAESIRRVQTSVKAAIERLQRRREAKPPISAIEKV
jgi:HAMP domain-containing protein